MIDNDDLRYFMGKRVTRVDFNDDEATLHLDDGNRARFSLSGDCCSHSYFTDRTQFDELVGALIGYVEERGERDGFEGNEKYPTANGETQWSFLVFVTHKGHITIDWRNDSNGYYSGSISLEIE